MFPIVQEEGRLTCGVALGSERKLCHQVHANTLLLLLWEQQMLQYSCWTLPIVLHTKTYVTRAYIFNDVLSYLRPPKELSR